MDAIDENRLLHFLLKAVLITLPTPSRDYFVNLFDDACAFAARNAGRSAGGPAVLAALQRLLCDKNTENPANTLISPCIETQAGLC